MLQLKCPETGKPVGIQETPPETAFVPMTLATHIREIPCPYCGEGHMWTSSHLSLAMQTLRDSPGATRVLVDGGSAAASS